MVEVLNTEVPIVLAGFVYLLLDKVKRKLPTKK